MFILEPRAAEQVLDLALAEQRVELEQQNASCDLRLIAAQLVSVVLGGDPNSIKRMNHAQLISCTAYFAFVTAPFTTLQRPWGYDFPKSLLCFAAAWWEDQHLGVIVTVGHEEALGRRLTTAMPLNAGELFPREGARMDQLPASLQAMFQGLVDAANQALPPGRDELHAG